MRRPFWILAVPVLCLAVLSFAPTAAHAQSNTISISPDVSLNLGGSIQTRAYYTHADINGLTTARLGFGVRRARLMYRINIGERWGLVFQNELTGNAPSFIDLFLTYQVNDRFSLRMGRMPDAQPRSFLLTPFIVTDSYDRPNVSRQWAARTIAGDGRDFGISAHFTTETSRLLLFLHNGSGDWDRNLGGASYTEGSVDTGLAVSAYAEHRPSSLEGVEVGAFVGRNTNKGRRTSLNGNAGRNYTSYSAHIYYGALPGSQPFRVKVDLLGVEYNRINDSNPSESTLGLNVLGAALVQPWAEAFVQAEQLGRDFNNTDISTTYLTAGITLSPSAWESKDFNAQRFTLAYEYQADDGAPNDRTFHRVIAQLQLVF
ncbi:MAG: porin [Bacteroidota bacterium]